VIALLDSFRKGTTAVVEKFTSGDDKTAKVIAHFTGEKKKILKSELDNRKARIQQEENLLRDKIKKLTTLKRSTISLEEKYKELAKQKRLELVESYRKVITKLKLSPLIEAFDVDTKKRVLITTRPLTVKKDNWKKLKVAGVYQIRLDFSVPSHTQGIEILNLTQNYNEFQSPHINRTSPCWGNLGPDIEKEFKTQDIYELVMDMIEYITSPHDADGYISMPNKGKDSGWEQFFKEAKPRPPKYSFEKYEQENKEKGISGIMTSTGGAIQYEAIASGIAPYGSLVTPSIQFQNGLQQFANQQQGALQQAQLEQAYTQMAYTTSTFTGGSGGGGGGQVGGHQWMVVSPYVNHQPVSRYQEEIKQHLMRMGFREESAWHYLQMVAPEGSRFASRLELRMNTPEEVILFVYRENIAPMAEMMMNPETPPAMPESRVQIERFFVNTTDLTRQGLEDIKRNHVMTYRVQPHDYMGPQEGVGPPPSVPGPSTSVSESVDIFPSTSVSASPSASPSPAPEEEGAPDPRWRDTAIREAARERMMEEIAKRSSEPEVDLDMDSLDELKRKLARG
jgi:hypothetical protein